MKKAFSLLILSLFILAFACPANALTINNNSGLFNTINTNHGTNGFVYSTALSTRNNPRPVHTVATFVVNPNEQLRILGLGVGGDIGASSASVAFDLTGGGLNFVFSGGINGFGGSNLSLGSCNGCLHTQIGGPAVLTATEGENVTLRFTSQVDPDGAETNDTDPFGNVFNDPNETARVWINYEVITNNNSAVPEPATLGLLVLAGGLLFFKRKVLF